MITRPLNSDKKFQHIIFLVFVLALIIHLIFTFTGFYNDDDINYVRYAADIASNGFSEQIAVSHFQLRWTVIYVTAFFYKIFGISTFSSALCSFISVIGSGFLITKMIRQYNPVIFTFTLLMYFFAYSTLFYMQRTLPDVTICFAVSWMYYSYRSFTGKPANPIKYGVQFSLALMLAIITKESIIIALPLFFILFLNDLFKKRNSRFWSFAVASSVLLVFLYLLYFKITTGSFLFRYHLLQAGSYFSECSYNKLPFLFTLKRIGYQLWENMLINGDGLILMPSLTACLYLKKIKSYGRINNLDCFSFLILLCAANFMTISFTNYVPLCPAPRHFMFLFPFAAIVGGPIMYAFFKDPRKFLLLPVFMMVATCILFYLGAGNTKYLYLLFSMILLARLILSFIIPSKIAFIVCTLAFILLFCLNYIIDFVQPKYPFYWNHKKVVVRSLKENKLTGTLFSADGMSGELTEFFLKFKTENLRILPIDSVKPFNPGTLYFLHVGDINPGIQMQIDTLMNKSNNPTFILLDKEENVSLFKVDNAFLNNMK